MKDKIIKFVFSGIIFITPFLYLWTIEPIKSSKEPIIYSGFDEMYITLSVWLLIGSWAHVSAEVANKVINWIRE